MARQEHAEGGFTYADYLTWPEGERWEIIDGEAFDMTPAPATRHQQVLTELLFRMRGALDDHPCKIFPAPFDVRLPQGGVHEDEAIVSVVQPDLSVVCDAEKIDRRGCVGAPDLVVEILSPATAYRDQSTKLALYERSGVQEYWVVNPGRRSVQVYLLDGEGGYTKPVEYRSPETLPSPALPGLSVNLEQIFTK